MASDLNGGTPAPDAGQAGSAAPSQPSEPQGGQPGGATSTSEPDPFAFADGNAGSQTPANADGQGAQPDQTPAAQPPVTPQPAPAGKSYLTDEFGGDVAKLDKAYGELRPFATKLAQNNKRMESGLREATSALEFLDKHLGPEIEQLLVQKGLMKPADGAPAAPPQPGAQTPATPQGSPEDRPLTMRDLQAMQQRQERFNTMVAEFRTAHPQWDQYKPQIRDVLTKHPFLATAIVQGNVPMSILFQMARGMVFDDRVKSSRDAGLKEGLMGKDARAAGTVEGSSMGTSGGKGDGWDFVR